MPLDKSRIPRIKPKAVPVEELETKLSAVSAKYKNKVSAVYCDLSAVEKSLVSAVYCEHDNDVSAVFNKCSNGNCYIPDNELEFGTYYDNRTKARYTRALCKVCSSKDRQARRKTNLAQQSKP